MEVINVLTFILVVVIYPLLGLLWKLLKSIVTNELKHINEQLDRMEERLNELEKRVFELAGRS